MLNSKLSFERNVIFLSIIRKNVYNNDKLLIATNFVSKLLSLM